jgi:hypothetical protein
MGRYYWAHLLGRYYWDQFTRRGWYDSQLLGRESLAAVADPRAQLVKESRQLVKKNSKNKSIIKELGPLRNRG